MEDDTIARFQKFLHKDEEHKHMPVHEKPKYKEIPDYLLCRITDDLMEEPVIIQSGFTYEKKSILLHFKTNGNFDPISRYHFLSFLKIIREPVDPNIMIPNKYIKQATEHYLER